MTSTHQRLTFILLTTLFSLGCSESSENSSGDSPKDNQPPNQDQGGLFALGSEWSDPPESHGFVEVKTGISDFHHDPGADGEYRFPEIVGSGCVLFDFDGDDDLDAYLVQAGPWADRENIPSKTNRLYENRGHDFVDVTEASGLGDSGYGMGAVAGDYDNDGDLDLWVSNFGASRLYQNQGNGTFGDATKAVGLGEDLEKRWWATSAAVV